MAGFRRNDEPGAECLIVTGEIDLAVEDAFRDAVRDLIADAGSPVVLDLTGVTFFGAAGLHVLVETQEMAGTRDLGLVIRPSRSVRLTLDAAGVADRLSLDGASGDGRAGTAGPGEGRARDTA